MARGVFVYAKTDDRQYWHARHMAQLPFCSNQAIYAQACSLLTQAPSCIREIGISCYELSRDDDPQLSLFGDQLAQERAVTEAIDDINRRYGERTIHSADTLGTSRPMRVKVPFGSTRFL